MKTNKKSLLVQRQVIEKKIRPWMSLSGESSPPSGWIKAVRGALGMNVRQLADFVGVGPSAVTQFEKREPQKKVTLELLEKIASAMNCKLVYAIIPDAPYKSLEDIIDKRAQGAAAELIHEIGHSMRLEAQGLDNDDIKKQVERLAYELKARLDSRIWDKPRSKKGAKWRG